MRPVALCCLLALLAVIPARGGDLEAAAALTAAGMAALENGDRATAARQLELGARKGNRLAAYQLAILLLDGDDPGTNRLAAWQWLRRAATAGLAEARMRFARLYDQGQLVPRSTATALHFYRLAAEQGLVEAQVTVGTLYFLGQGTAQDYAQAARWYRAAAEGGDAGAQYLIANMYEEGYGVVRDLDQARRWYGAAARQGDPLAASRAEALALPSGR